MKRRKPGAQVACCPECAKAHAQKDVPSKTAWCDKEETIRAARLSPQSTKPTFKEHVNEWSLWTRHDGTHYASWAEDSSFEHMAALYQRPQGAEIVVQRKEASKQMSVPLAVITRLVELDGEKS